MSNNNGIMDSQGSSTDIPQATPGALLKAAREAAKLSEDDIARELRIPLGNVEALESDQYENLASETFVLGYIRAYARILKLDAEHFIKAYHQYRGQLQQTTATITKTLEKEPQQETAQTPVWRKTATWIGGFLFAWLLLFNLFDQDAETQTTLSAPAEVVAEEAVGNKDSFPELGAEENLVEESQVTVAEPEAEVEPEAVIDQAPAVAPAEPEFPVVSEGPNSALDTLVMSFSGECWLEVTDARGDVLSADLQQDGDQVVLQGEAPFEVMLGNVRAVTAVLNDEPVELKPRGFRKTLRTKIGE
ncbi:cytoskeleton protein RodZ [Maricurvus nonylphenolicus]|uniref:RodZ domain-containing protein n=1 Tax=Maricurvus nonylphenolicus TaxID=1008307 RepID=UPI0036F2164D